MEHTLLTDPAFTFVVRFWIEWSEGSPLWRGSIRHLQSGRELAFQSLDSACGFIDSCLPPSSRSADRAWGPIPGP